MKELWKDIPGFEGIYKVSNLGRIYSAPRENSIGLMRKGRFMRPDIGKKGYPQIMLRFHNRVHREKVHRIVLRAFIGECPDGYECRHLDGNSRNCNLSNLEWGTKEQNQADRIRHGTITAGSSHPNAKLKTKDVLRMRKLSSEGWTCRELEREFGMSDSQVSKIVNRLAWTHI